MYQVSLKYIEITGLRKQNQDLVDMGNVKQGLKNQVEEHCRELEVRKSELEK